MGRYEIRLSGSGGQGIILAGRILAYAAAIYEGKNAVQSQSYGPEARGGASRAEVIISEEDIDYPKCTSLDALLVLTQESLDKYLKDLKDNGILLADKDAVKNIPAGKYKLYHIPFIGTAENNIGKGIVANIVALGALVKATKIVSEESITQAVLNRVPKGTEDLNINAIRSGFGLITD